MNKKYILIYMLLLPLIIAGCGNNKSTKKTSGISNVTNAKSQPNLLASPSKIITMPSGLKYQILRKGTGKTPKATDKVTVNYRGAFVDGREFDSSYKRGKPATFPVNGVIKGWTQALQMMKEGSKWHLIIPPDLAYGPMGSPPVIPPNSTLYFDIELLKVQ